MPYEAPTISVVIISTSHLRLQTNLPRVIAAARGVVAEVILVCQGYQPDVSRMDSMAALKVLHSPSLLGTSQARNCGVDHAIGEFICFLDDDVHPQPDFFQSTLNYLAANPSAAGVLGAIQVEGDAASPLFRKFRRPAASCLGAYGLWRLANGNSGVFRRTGLRFDPRLGVGTSFGAFEDADYLLAISRLGPLGFLPKAILFHPDMDESETRDAARMRGYARGLGGCFSKNHGGSALAFLLASVLNNLASFIRPRPYSSFRARLSHMEAAAAKILAIPAWYRYAKNVPRVVPQEVRMLVSSVGERASEEARR